MLEIPKLLHAHGAAAAAGFGAATLWVAGIVAGLTAYASTAFLMRYFRHREESAALDPFAYYCWLVGGLALLWLKLG